MKNIILNSVLNEPTIYIIYNIIFIEKVMLFDKKKLKLVFFK